MFKIDFIVEDRHLSKILHALAGFSVLNLHTVPVVNAVAKNGKVEQNGPDATMAQLIAAELAKAGSGAIVTANDIKAAVGKSGGSEGSYSYFTKSLVQAGALKRLKTRGTYKLTY